MDTPASLLTPEDSRRVADALIRAINGHDSALSLVSALSKGLERSVYNSLIGRYSSEGDFGRKLVDNMSSAVQSALESKI